MSSNDTDSRDDPRYASESNVDMTRTIYSELRKLAAARMAREYGPQTLQATALVHEAWLRVGADNHPQWASRAQFFSAAAEAMRRILVDRARKRQALRHGGGQHRIDLDDSDWDVVNQIAAPADDEMLLALHDALDRLAEGDPESADLIKMRYFAGMTVEETAEATGLAKRTVERRLSFARAWLGREMENDSKN